VIELLEDLKRLEADHGSRPLAAVLKARREAAEESVDIKRLLPRPPRTHRTAELQSRWFAAGRIDERWADEWERILDLPLEQIRDVISEDTVRGRELRQSSPFSGALSEHERKALVEAVARRVE
jgi:hypothetical protein